MGIADLLHLDSVIAVAYYGTICFLSLRVLHRLYYFFRGHVQYLSFSPRQDMERFLLQSNIQITEKTFRSKRDGTTINYRVLGNGSKIVLLANGVGTDFFMWLPTLKNMYLQYPQLFTEITLLVPSYRGLFGSDAQKEGDDVEITIDNIVEDIQEVLKNESVKRLHAMVGWSMGAQTCITCCAKYPTTADRLFLLNPSTGHTLHGALQPVAPFPKFFGVAISSGINSLHKLLRPLTYQPLWDTLKAIIYSRFFRFILEISSFFGGFPPEQAPYFHEYMRDVFNNRKQTRGLLDLILALDAPCPDAAMCLPHQATIISGIPDIMTGCYHSTALEKKMKKARHVTFTMGSHFLLIEWPDLLATEILRLLFEESR